MEEPIVETNNQKVLSIAIPSYNSEAYMANCIESLLIGGDDVEILIVNDGSKDGTAQIADAYAAKYPNIIRAVHQENGGHGEAVNAGLRNATGRYFKVVDSDDWVDPKAYKEILALLKQMIAQETQLDMLISNFIYDKQGVTYKKVMHYRSVLPKDQIFTWDQIGHFQKGQYILMYSVIYRTQLLRDCAMELPKHTFYVDNIFVYQPLPFVKTIYYLDVDFYHYFIGRDDQSVNEKVMIKRLDQQIRVNKLMADYYDLSDKTVVPNKKLRNYMYNYLEIITCISSIMAILSHDQANMV
ncbi:MAG: glycosyltransferase, partial [Peptococcaceae bacterium]|nr:glycosyltransferase [Peptococcaceae bacterium]